MIQEKPINIFPPSEHSDPIRRGLGTQYAINSTSQGQLSVEDPPSSPFLHAGSGDAEPWVTRKKELGEPKTGGRQAGKDTSLVSGSVELLDQVPPERRNISFSGTQV